MQARLGHLQCPSLCCFLVKDERSDGRQRCIKTYEREREKIIKPGENRGAAWETMWRGCKSQGQKRDAREKERGGRDKDKNFKKWREEGRWRERGHAGVVMFAIATHCSAVWAVGGKPQSDSSWLCGGRQVMSRQTGLGTLEAEAAAISGHLFLPARI